MQKRHKWPGNVYLSDDRLYLNVAKTDYGITQLCSPKRNETVSFIEFYFIFYSSDYVLRCKT